MRRDFYREEKVLLEEDFYEEKKILFWKSIQKKY